MKTKFLALVLAAAFMATPVFAQEEINQLTPVDAQTGKVIAVQEHYATKPNGNLVIDRTVLTQHDGTVHTKTVTQRSGPVLVYDDIEEPLFIDSAVGTDIPTSDSTRVIYHFE